MTTMPPHTPALIWIQQVDPNIVQYDHYLMVCAEYIEWLKACGVTDPFQDPASWVQPGDLQSFCNVVSKWPKRTAQGYSAPTLFSVLDGLRIQQNFTTRTFAAYMDFVWDKVANWMRSQRMDPDNPNETPEERAKRKNREGVAKHRLLKRLADPDTAPEIYHAQMAVQHAGAMRKWLRDVERIAKDTYDGAVASAKLAKLATISEAKEQVAQAELAASNAQAAIDNK